MIESRMTQGVGRWLSLLMLMLTMVVGCTTGVDSTREEGSQGSQGPGGSSARGPSARLAQGGVTKPGQIKAGQTPMGGPAIATDSATYNQGDPVQVNWGTFPGNAQDWVAVAAVGSANTEFVAFSYTGGATTGSVSFGNVPPGNYVARGFSNNTYTLIATSTQFTVGGGASTVTSDQASYQAADTAQISWTGAPGFTNDWIAISVAGSPATQFVSYVYTNGQVAGTQGFAMTGLNGSYVARLYTNNTYNIAAESTPFTVGVAAMPSVTTDNTTYNSGDDVIATWATLPGNASDWIAIAPAGSPNTTFTTYVYTAGQVAGQNTFSGLADGTYVARAFENNGYNLLAQSPQFTIGNVGGPATLTTNANNYQNTDTVIATFAGASGSASDWVAIAPQGSPNTTYPVWGYTNGGVNGTVNLPLTGLADGTYVARLFDNNGFTLRVESAPFTIGAPPAPAVSTDQATYNNGDPVVVSFSALPGNAQDWVSVALDGSPDTSFVDWSYTSAQVSGTRTFNNLAPGTYVARAYSNNSFTVIATSVSFTINP